MTLFFNLIGVENKEDYLSDLIEKIAEGEPGDAVYSVKSSEFINVPGTPYCYQASNKVRGAFKRFEKLQSEDRWASFGASTKDDFRFLRLWWEVPSQENYRPLAKGGEFSPFYTDYPLVVSWKQNAYELKVFLEEYRRSHGWSPHWTAELKSSQYYGKPGITWGRRTQKFAPKILPRGSVFGDKGPAILVANDSDEDIYFLLAVVNSDAFRYLVGLSLNSVDTTARSFEVGVIQNIPIPTVTVKEKAILVSLASNVVDFKLELAKTRETSNFFSPSVLFKYANSILSKVREAERSIRASLDKINEICFKLYEFSESDARSARKNSDLERVLSEDDLAMAKDDALVSLIVGCVFERFSLVQIDDQPKNSAFQFPHQTEQPISESDSKSFKAVISEDDLIRSVADIIEDAGENRVISIKNLDKYISKEFFNYHLGQYSKSRRQAPIYWPLQTASGSYTLWLYYHRLNQQSLYICVNDFVEPKLDQVEHELNALRGKPARSSQEEKEFEKLSDLASELRDFRDELLRLAKFWKPNLNDGVQISAAPLWKLFQHKAWQKKLKDTWESLKKGDYDWAHLACSFWPERVLRKCHQDHSLAIAHDVEGQFWEEVEVPVIRRGKDTGETKLEWQPKDLSESELNALIKRTIEERGLQSESR
jgi:hypothetical protein